MAEKKADEKPPAPPKAPASYRVLSSGLSTPAGPVFRGAVLPADQVGDVARIASLLDKGAIEAAE